MEQYSVLEHRNLTVSAGRHALIEILRRLAE